MSSVGASALHVALRNGATCVLNEGALTIGENTFTLAALVSATLVADMSVPVAPGIPPAPAVALRLGDGASFFLTPVEQSDAMRLLQAIHAARPDLGMPGPGPVAPPTGPSYGPGYGPGYAPPPPGYGYAPPQMGYGYGPTYAAPAYPGYQPQSSAPDSDRGLAVLAHLSGFILPAILPFILWLALRTSHPYASKQAKQAFVFQLCLWVVGIMVVGGLYSYSLYSLFSFTTSMPVPTDPTAPPTAPLFPAGLFITFFLMEGAALLWSLTNLVASVVASVQVAQGKPFHYPLLGRL